MIMTMTPIVFCSDLAESYQQCELSTTDAKTLDENFRFAGQGSLEYIRFHIENFPSVGIRDKEGNLVAWELTYFTGNMGMLYVVEGHRRKGLAKFMICKLAQKHIKSGRRVFSSVDETNALSLKIHQSCGFTILEEHSTYVAKLKNGD